MKGGQGEKVWPDDGCAKIRHDGGTQIVVLADWIALCTWRGRFGMFLLRKAE